MRDLLLAFPVPFLATALSQDDLTFWERVLEKWGIGLIGLGLFLLLAKWTTQREDKALVKRLAQEEADRVERITLAKRNIELLEEQKHEAEARAIRLERLVAAGNKSNDDHASALRMLVRKMRRMPCIGDIDDTELPEHKPVCPNESCP